MIFLERFLAILEKVLVMFQESQSADELVERLKIRAQAEKALSARRPSSEFWKDRGL